MGSINKFIVSLGGLFALSCCHLLSTDKKDINQLAFVEVSKNRLSTQIMFGFQGPIQFTPSINQQHNQLIFSFPGTSIQAFNSKAVLAKFQSLKKDGLIRNVSLQVKKTPEPMIALVIEFAPYRSVNNGDERTRNKFLVKWNTLENSYRLIIDIFLKEDLDQLTKKDAILLHTRNDAQQYDVQPVYHQQPHIVIDPGHGGKDTGAKGHFGAIEKDITLKIAKKLHKELKNHGYTSLLTRSDDKTLSLEDRSNIAHQLRADLLVSIHVNASKKPRDMGLETYFFNCNELYPRKGKTGFLFVNIDKNLDTIKRLNNHTAKTIEQSKRLAQAIQTNIIKNLRDNSITINDRGIKPEKFRVFLQTEIPSSLVEIGFLTNHKEARNLMKKSYQKIIAQGIYQGIESYLKQESMSHSSQDE